MFSSVLNSAFHILSCSQSPVATPSNYNIGFLYGVGLRAPPPTWSFTLSSHTVIVQLVVHGVVQTVYLKSQPASVFSHPGLFLLVSCLYYSTHTVDEIMWKLGLISRYNAHLI